MEATVSQLLILQKYISSKKKDSEVKDYTLCLGNISRDFTINNMKKQDQKELYFFSVDSTPTDTNDVLDIYKYLMKKPPFINLHLNEYSQ